jgi:hypothetical protein
MKREEAEAVVALRDYLVTGPSPFASGGDLMPLYYLLRPNRSLPRPFHVVSFFVWGVVKTRRLRVHVPHLVPPRLDFDQYLLVDPQVKALLSASRGYRWRDGGVREWDGLVFDGSVPDLIERVLSRMLFGDAYVLDAREL